MNHTQRAVHFQRLMARVKQRHVPPPLRDSGRRFSEGKSVIFVITAASDSGAAYDP